MKVALIGIGSGLAGMLLMLVVWHVYADHVTLHQTVDFLNSQIQAAQKK